MPASDALDLRLHHLLDQARQIFVQPRLQPERSVSRTTSSSGGSCFFTVSGSVLNAEPTTAVASRESSPASGFLPVACFVSAVDRTISPAFVATGTATCLKAPNIRWAIFFLSLPAAR